MSGFLDQREIDKIQAELTALKIKKELAESAKEKIKLMYYDTTGSPLFSDLDSLEEIGKCINTIDNWLKPDSKYSMAFISLKSNYLKRI